MMCGGVMCRNRTCTDCFPPKEKSPLGLMPRDIWEEQVMKQRLEMVMDAISRFMEAEELIPDAWIDELGELNNRLRERKSRKCPSTDTTQQENYTKSYTL